MNKYFTHKYIGKLSIEDVNILVNILKAMKVDEFEKGEILFPEKLYGCVSNVHNSNIYLPAFAFWYVVTEYSSKFNIAYNIENGTIESCNFKELAVHFFEHGINVDWKQK